MARSIPRSIVVLGASSGGVEALVEVLGGLPADLPASLFVVLHLSPGRRSGLASILGRATQLVVETAVDGAAFEHGHVYVAPPDRHLVLDGHCMRLGEGPAQHRSRPSIDVLFRSAAVAHGAAVVGVVLSGQQDDGSLGLATVTHCGGIGIVQEPADARFPEMPANAIAADDPQIIVPLREIAARIVAAIGTLGTDIDIPRALQLEAWADARLGRGASGHEGGDMTVEADDSLRALWLAVRLLDEHARIMAGGAERLSASPELAARYLSRRAELQEAGRALHVLIDEIGERWAPPQRALV
jgi:hypothetical protein